jgi:signal transduction histidine kinase
VNRERPLDGIRSIKAKLGVLVGLSVVAASIVSEVGDRAGVPVWLTVPVTVAGGLGVAQWLATGMTSPLREMTAAAAVMATGDYSRRITTGSTDEVGQLARAFNTMAADLATSDQQRRQLVATVSHELRTPLTAQQALLENLVDGVVTPDDAALRTALAQAERLGDLVSDLLDLSRVDGGLARLHVSEVDVAALVEQGVAEARAGGADRRGVAIVSSVETDGSLAGGRLMVQADGARLAQVLANVLDNAVRHSPVGGTVTVRSISLDRERWALEVVDEGPGIPGARADQVFDRFGSWDESGGGTGLGLAIASWVCELHGGSISVLPPEPGAGGARIRAVLPRRPAPTTSLLPSSSAQQVPQEPALAEHSTRSDGHPLSTQPEHHTKEHAVTSIPGPSPAFPGPSQPPSASQPAPLPSPGVPPPPFTDAIFGDLWPERGLTTRPRLVLGSVAIGLVASLVLPERNLGLGAFVLLLLAAALVLSESPRRLAPWTIVSGVIGVGLVSLIVLRAAEWLAVIGIGLSGVLLMTALTGARSIPSMVGGWASWVLAGIRGLPLLRRTLSSMSKVSVLWPIVRTVAISLVLLVVFGGLFASGDAIFGSWAAAIIPDLAVDSLVLRAFVGFGVGGTVLAACYVAVNPPRVDRLTAPPARKVSRPWEWLVPVGLVVAVFVAFVVAQATAMWGGHDYVQRTTGLTYAEYVHQGFGQLTAVTLLTLATVGLAARKAPSETPRDRLLLRVVLGLLCVLALVVVASALFRMSVYQQAYGYTVLRVLVDAFELWLGLLLVLVLVAGIRLSGRWLPRAALISGAAFVLVIGLANPEAWVAERNIARYHATGQVDAIYLLALGPDATPAIQAGLPAPLAQCITQDWSRSSDDLLEWNLGRSRAASLDPGLARTAQSDCNALVVSSSTR